MYERTGPGGPVTGGAAGTDRFDSDRTHSGSHGAGAAGVGAAAAGAGLGHTGSHSDRRHDNDNDENSRRREGGGTGGVGGLVSRAPRINAFGKQLIPAHHYRRRIHRP